jgi:ribose transport system substrate-binding protein
MRIMAAAFAVLIASLGAAEASPQGKRVAVLVTLNTNPYIGAYTSTFAREAAKDGIKVTTFESPYDAAIQSQQMDDAIAQKYDLILLNYINDRAILPAMTRAKAAKVPVVLIAAPLQKEQEALFVSYMGLDHHDLGRIAGEHLVKALAEEGKTKARVAAITGLASQLHVQQRIEAFKAVLAEHPGIELVAQEDGKWNTQVSETIAGQLLVRHNAQGGIDGFFAMADNQATGVIQALEAAGMKVGAAEKGKIVVASNCMKDGINHIKSGEQYSTATQIPTEEASFAAKRIAAFFNGETLKKYEILPAAAIDKSDVDKYAEACSY